MKQRTASSFARSLRACLSPFSRKPWIPEALSFSAKSLSSENRRSRSFTTTILTELNSKLWRSNTSESITEKNIRKDSIQRPKVIFVLGGPGSGKGTQCSLIVEHFGFTHLSAGDLLRAEIKSDSENGRLIRDMIKEGKIVPSSVTVKLLQNAMERCGNMKFLIDGFPRNDENRNTFELETGIIPEFVLYLDCSEAEMEKRLLTRNQGRDDDNITTIRKRFNVFAQSSLPVITHYESVGKVHKIDAARTKEEVFESVKSLFLPPLEKIS